MAARFLGIEFTGKPKKHAKVGVKQKFKVHGDNLDLTSSSQILTITMVSDVTPSPIVYKWTVDPTNHPSSNSVRFEATLSITTAAPKKPVTTGDMGDLTITLDYSGEPDDLVVECPNVEHEP